MNKLEKVSKYFIVFLIFSFLGWCMETVYKWILLGHFEDRGFLTLPFCTIYGFCVIVIFLLMGTPQNKRGILSKVDNPVIRVFIYAVLAMVVATFAELVTAVFFDLCFDTMLWNYSEEPLNFRGYICLTYSIIWGILITAIMALVFDPLLKLVSKIKSKPAIIISIAFASLLVIDWIINFILLIV